MAKTSRFPYKQRSAESVQARANNKGGMFDSYIKPNYKMYKIKEGKNIIRFLPPTWDAADHYGLDIYINWRIGVENSSYLSLSKMGKGRDPIADAVNQARREGDDETAKALAPKYSVLAWVIDRTSEDEGPMLFRMPFTLDRDIAICSSDEDTKETFYIDKLEDGNDVRFYAVNAGKQNAEYPANKIKLLSPSPLSQDPAQGEEWWAYVNENPIPDCLQFYSYEHISNVFNGGQRKAVNEDEDGEIDPRAKPTGALTKGNGTPTAKPPFDTGDDDVDDENEAPPAKPAPAPVSGGTIRERLAARHKVAPKRAELDDED